jgi:3-oxoacyl-[acyl-carrier protein] reductase
MAQLRSSVGRDDTVSKCQDARIAACGASHAYKAPPMSTHAPSADPTPRHPAAPAATMPITIITGAGSGVGAATARLLAARGHGVLVHYHRSEAAALEVVRACIEAGTDAIAVSGDVGDDAVCRKLADCAIERWGRIDGLVNCAAMTRFVPLSELERVDAQEFIDLYRVNAIGPFQMARAVAPHMQEGASIVCVSSIAGQLGSGSSFPYVLSKGALNALTLGLARTLAPKIRVNAVLPGMIDGRWMREGIGDDAFARVSTQFSAHALTGRICSNEEIAAAIAWLLDPACMMTGQLMVVDGGFSLGRPPPSAGAR